MKFLNIVFLLGMMLVAAWAYDLNKSPYQPESSNSSLFYRYELRVDKDNYMLFDTATGDIFLLDRRDRVWEKLNLPRVVPNDGDQDLLLHKLHGFDQ